jgi:HEAT repeat protein
MAGQEQIVQGLIHALVRDENYMVRSVAARALAKLDAPEATPALLNALRDKAGFIIDFATKALSDRKDPAALPTLMTMLVDEDADIRRAAISILAASNHQAAIPQIISLLDDPTPAVGHAAATALGMLQAQEAVPDLIAAIQSPHSDWGMCINAAQALGHLGSAQAVEAMIELLRRRWEQVPGMNTTPPVRKNVLEALVRIGEPAVPYLLLALKDQDVKVRHAAVEALGSIASGEALGVDGA